MASIIRPLGAGGSDLTKIERGPRAAVAQWATPPSGLKIADSVMTEVVSLPVLGFTQFAVCLRNDPAQAVDATNSPPILYYRIIGEVLSIPKTLFFGPISPSYNPVKHYFADVIDTLRLWVGTAQPIGTTTFAIFKATITVLS